VEGQMRVVVFAIILCCLATSLSFAADPPKINLAANAMTLKDATDEIAKQAGISIVLDPKAKGTITASLNGAEVAQVLDVITKMNNLTWKKLTFARKDASKVSLDQLKSGILALASMPLMGLAVEDPATKTSAVFAKDIPSAPDTANVGLPQGYTWSTVYVVLAPEAPAPVAKATDKVKDLGQKQAQSVMDLAMMTPEQRRQVYADQWTAAMRLTPEARQAMLQDQMTAIQGLDSQTRGQLLHDMSRAMRHSFGATIRQNQNRPQNQNRSGGTRGH